MTNYNGQRVPFRKPKRRIMRRFRMSEISAVDVPAQKDATATIIKRRRPMSLYDPPALQAIYKAREKLSALEEDLRGNSRATGPTEEIDRAELDGNFDDDELATLQEIDDEAEDEAAERLRALLGKEEEAEEDEEDEDASGDILAAAYSIPADEDSDEEFPDKGIGRTANILRRRDPRISKRRALLMAAGRRAAERGTYTTTFGKVASRITTDAHEPFHQPSAAERRAEMDRTARAHRSSVNAEIEAMRGAFGREREERRRVIDKMVVKLREVDRNMPHTVALRKIMAQYPGLFG